LDIGIKGVGTALVPIPNQFCNRNVLQYQIYYLDVPTIDTSPSSSCQQQPPRAREGAYWSWGRRWELGKKETTTTTVSLKIERMSLPNQNYRRSGQPCTQRGS